MGWWGYGPIEGDTPIDIMYTIECYLMGIDADAKHDFEQEQFDAYTAALHARLRDEKTIVRLVTNKDELHEGDEQIFWHVLAYLVMSAGGAIDPIKANVITATTNDEWAKRSPERANAMIAFRRAVMTYTDGAPFVYQSKSLLDAFEQSPHVYTIKPKPKDV